MKPITLVVHSSGALIIMDKKHLPILQNNDWTKPPLGVATTYVENGVLKAHCYFHSLDATYYAMFPSCSGESANRSLHVRAISVGAAPNVDKRIKSIGAQIEDQVKASAPQPAAVPAMTKEFTNVPASAGMGAPAVIPPVVHTNGKPLPFIVKRKR